MIGRVLNARYRLNSLLGEGGMAVVYEAEDLLLGRKVAIKVLREQFASDTGFLARFQREARAAAALSHPNVVAVYDVGTDGGTQFIVMELVQGRTLKEIIEQETPLGAARIIGLGRQLCEALDYAHQQRLVHRDVKPHNILVSQDGRAKIADFGIAVALGASSLTQSGYVIGSAQYISPEQAQGEPTTASSDLYSAGVVLYEMATGRLPFEGETTVAVALKHVRESPVPPRALNPRIPESLQSVILRAMSKEPAGRFASGNEMAEALVECARAGLEATQPHRLEPSRPPTERSAPSTPSGRPVAMRGETPQPPAPISREGGRRSEEARGRDPHREMASVPPAPRRDRRQGSGGWMVLMVVFAAFLCTLGAIPAGILAYSSGALERFLPGLVVAVAPSPTASPTTAPTLTPIPEPTSSPTATPVPIRVPRLVGMPFPAARQLAQAAGLDVVIAGEAYDSQIPVAAVVSQRPEADAGAESGTRIEVVVSLGKEFLAVPRVVGDMSAAAQGKLRSAGFRWRVEEEISDRVPAGVVVSQRPAPETRAERGTEVMLTVSLGREKVVVPNVVGLPEADAQEAIVKAGLSKSWPNYQDYTFVPPGHVLSQEPKPGTMAEKGSTVYIAVRRPEPATPTPPPPATKSPRKERD